MRHFRIFYFWEQATTDLGPLGRGYVVGQESAAPTHDETERAGIAADHRGMVRFETPSAQGFRMVADALLRYSAEAGEVVRRRREEAGGVLERERGKEAEALLRSATWGSGASTDTFCSVAKGSGASTDTFCSVAKGSKDKMFDS